MIVILKFQQYQVFTLAISLIILTGNSFKNEGCDKLINKFIEDYKLLFDASSGDPIKGQKETLNNRFGESEGLTTAGNNYDEIVKVDKLKFKNQLKKLINRHQTIDPLIFYVLFTLHMIKQLRIIIKKN